MILQPETSKLNDDHFTDTESEVAHFSPAWCSTHIRLHPPAKTVSPHTPPPLAQLEDLSLSLHTHTYTHAAACCDSLVTCQFALLLFTEVRRSAAAREIDDSPSLSLSPTPARGKSRRGKQSIK